MWRWQLSWNTIWSFLLLLFCWCRTINNYFRINYENIFLLSIMAMTHRSLYAPGELSCLHISWWLMLLSMFSGICSLSVYHVLRNFLTFHLSFIYKFFGFNVWFILNSKYKPLFCLYLIKIFYSVCPLFSVHSFFYATETVWFHVVQIVKYQNYFLRKWSPSQILYPCEIF